MRISIVMATYNGAQYISEQLASFCGQTLLADELIVSDDASEDSTVEILRNFKKDAPFNVRIFVNKVNAGYNGNFANAIARASGDLVILSDQDDVWLPHKIRMTRDLFEDNPRIDVTIGDQYLADEHLLCSGLTKLGQYTSSGFASAQYVSGCATAFRSEFRDIFLPIPSGVTYDKWINDLAESLGTRHVYPVPLQIHRRHKENASTSPLNRGERASRHQRVFVAARDALGFHSRDRSREFDQHIHELEMLMDRLASAHMTKSPDLTYDIESSVERLSRRLAAACGRREVRRESGLRRARSAWKLWKSGAYEEYRGWQSLLKDLFWRSRRTV